MVPITAIAIYNFQSRRGRDAILFQLSRSRRERDREKSRAIASRFLSRFCSTNFQHEITVYSK